MIEDQRKKMSYYDYQRVMWENNNGYTIRAIASEGAITTKYVKKVINGWNDKMDEWRRQAETEILARYACISGCGRWFTEASGLMWHVEFYTSGDNPLSCEQVMPR